MEESRHWNESGNETNFKRFFRVYTTLLCTFCRLLIFSFFLSLSSLIQLTSGESEERKRQKFTCKIGLQILLKIMIMRVPSSIFTLPVSLIFHSLSLSLLLKLSCQVTVTHDFCVTISPYYTFVCVCLTPLVRSIALLLFQTASSNDFFFSLPLSLFHLLVFSWSKESLQNSMAKSVGRMQNIHGSRRILFEPGLLCLFLPLPLSFSLFLVKCPRPGFDFQQTSESWDREMWKKEERERDRERESEWVRRGR